MTLLKITERVSISKAAKKKQLLMTGKGKLGGEGESIASATKAS